MHVTLDRDELFWRLCRVDSPTALWEVLDRLEVAHPLYREGYGAEEALKGAAQVVLYGAGKFAEAVIDSWAKQGISPDYCVDSDERKRGGSVRDIPVRDPQVLLQGTPPLVVIAAMATSQIEEKLQEWNIPRLYAERDGSVGYFPGHWLGRHRAEFERVYRALSDGESRRVMLEVAKARMFQRYSFPMRGNYFSSEVASYPQYFREDIFSFSMQEFFVDCGAFDGDTLIAFSALMHRRRTPRWNAIAFETDRLNADRTRASLTRYGIGEVEVVCAAVGVRDAVASPSDYFNCRQGEECGEVRVVSLDKALAGTSPTFIKMDIEGHETDALAGGVGIIQACRPKLAICSYHTTSQLLEVPLFILDNFPDYRLYMRHHSAGTLWETVCYAAAEKDICKTSG